MADPGTAPTESEIFVPTFECGPQCYKIVPLRVRSSLEPRRTSTGRSLGVFDWSVTIPAVARFGTPTRTFAADAWSPQDPTARAVPHGPGRVEVAAYEIDSSGVLGARLQTHTAGPALNGDTYVAFDNDGVGLVDPISPWTGTRVASGTPGVDVEFGSYVVDGVPDPVLGVMCHPVSAGTAATRTIILNHGGAFFGPGLGGNLGHDDLDFCIQMASRGWRVAMSAYRGFGIVTGASGPSSLLPAGVAHAQAPSIALSEFCSGEVIDVLQWTAIVRARPDTRDDRFLMIGGSHGGCITLRAVEQGAQVRAAIALAPITDFSYLFSRGVALDPMFATNAAPFYGGPPPPPGAMESRSPVRFTIDLSRRDDVQILIGAGLGDSIVPAQHSCELATLLGTSNHFLTSAGAFNGGAPTLIDPPTSPALSTACSTVTGWDSTRHEPTGWPAQRYFLLWDYGSGPTGPAIHVATFLYEPWNMGTSMHSSAIDSFIRNSFGP